MRKQKQGFFFRGELLAALLFGLLFNAHGQDLYVFYPTTIRPLVLQKKLSALCPELKVLVFGRYSDFAAKTAQDKPAAILSNPLVIRQFPEYAIRLEGMNGDSATEQLVLLSVGSSSVPEGTGSSSIGVVDILGRKNMENLIGTFISPLPQIKTVTNVEDLLQVLTFQMSSAVIISMRQYEFIKERSKLDFKTTPLPGARIGIVSLGLKANVDYRKTVKSVIAFDIETLRTLGVSRWKEK